ncbi:PEP-CTERM/exosortase system-associated acyltransferase [Halomonas sp. SpR1]|uniref:PEP-CTERM/exosortase system-associated acyltransferase n=1 Tax=Halomonas sp. SpR1 TaxID=3050462 RepID=UPI0027E3D79D|nr:PEP-CTERM/exosortase system-associated acyltransferase [Halomonas sp. SpR1]MDQ7735491.1 PEP-CTERM/exosortase system-associated acyltransferase [Halomonas sp. SpR1]
MKPLKHKVNNRHAPEVLIERFIKEFKFKICIDEHEKELVYRLRHDIYCEELQYEKASDPIKKLEFDIYDQNSIHCLIEHRRTGLVAGCVRVVVPTPSSPYPLNQLPLQSYGGQSLTHTELHPDRLDPESFYEISRLAVNRLFRTKPKEDIMSATSIAKRNTPFFSTEERKLFPLLATSLFITGYVLGRQLGKNQVFAMMEPSLPRLLALTGFHFTKVGETIDFHGRRSAYYINKQQAENGLKLTLLPLYLHIQQTLTLQLREVPIKEASTSLIT